MGFGQGLSGLNAASQNLDVIGNNIANSSTVGYKASTASFADVYASSRVGLGVSVAAINQRFTIGNVSTTGNQFDMAIDGEKGLFRLLDHSGAIVYSRNGEFAPNKDLYLTNRQGHRLTGYLPGSNDPQPIRVPLGNIEPSATKNIEFQANFNANALVLGAGAPEKAGEITLATDTNTSPTTAKFTYTIDAGGDVVLLDANGDVVLLDASGTSAPGSTPLYDTNGVLITALQANSMADIGTDYVAYQAAVAPIAFDPEDPTSFNSSYPMNVFDSLGNSHQLTQFFVKKEASSTGESVWEVHYLLDGATAQPAPVTLNFNSSGKLTSSSVARVPLQFELDQGNSPAETLEITVAYTGSTQFGGSFTVTPTQDGYETGEYASMSVAADGSIVANYTNGETKSMGTIVLADFNNLQGLRPIGGNAWIETAESGQARIGRPGENGLAVLKGQSVEESNVDMSQELVNMIIAQRTYQANAQTIKTQDQILQTLITLR